MTEPIDEGPYWYRCDNVRCHVRLWPIRRGETAECPGCGWSLSAIYRDSGGATAGELTACLDCELFAGTSALPVAAMAESEWSGRPVGEVLVRKLQAFHAGGHVS